MGRTYASGAYNYAGEKPHTTSKYFKPPAEHHQQRRRSFVSTNSWQFLAYARSEFLETAPLRRAGETQIKTTMDNQILETWDARISAVASALNTTIEDVTERLTEWGIDKEPMGVEMLDDDDVCKFGDFQPRFNHVNGAEVKQAKLRLAFKFLKGNKKAGERTGLDTRTVELRNRFGIEPTLGTIDTVELLKLYDPNRPTDPVTAELTTRYGDKPVIAFKPDSDQVDVEATAKYIAELAQGLPASPTVTSTGRLVTLVPVGQKPVIFLEEDPMYPGIPLRSGVSTVNFVDWTKTPLEARQFCRLLLEARMVKPDDRTEVNRLVKLRDAERDAQYPDVELDFRSRKQLGTLPTLKLQAGASASTTRRPNNPFGANTKY